MKINYRGILNADHNLTLQLDVSGSEFQALCFSKQVLTSQWREWMHKWSKVRKMSYFQNISLIKVIFLKYFYPLLSSTLCFYLKINTLINITNIILVIIYIYECITLFLIVRYSQSLKATRKTFFKHEILVYYATKYVTITNNIRS